VPFGYCIFPVILYIRAVFNIPKNKKARTYMWDKKTSSQNIASIYFVP